VVYNFVKAQFSGHRPPFYRGNIGFVASTSGPDCAINHDHFEIPAAVGESMNAATTSTALPQIEPPITGQDLSGLFSRSDVAGVDTS